MFCCTCIWLDRADVDFGLGQVLERGVQRGGLARTGGAGDEDDAVRLGDHPVPFFQVVFGEAEFAEILDQHFRIENAHDQLLAERRRHGRQPQFHLAAIGFDGLDAAVLRSAFFDHVHAAEHLDAAGHRCHYRRRNLVDRVQHAVDAETHVAGFAPRFEVDVAGALVEGVIEQPVADVYDVLVVGVELAALAQLDELLEVGDRTVGALILFGGALDRLGEVEELDDVVLDVEGVGDDPLDVQTQDLLERFLPVAHEGLAGRDGHFARRHAHRQDAIALRVGGGHQLGDRAEVDLERVDVQVRHADLAGHPFGQHFQMQQLARIARVLELLLVERHQRMVVAAVDAPVGQQALGVLLADQAVGGKVADQRIERNAAAGRDAGQASGARGGCDHGIGHAPNINVFFR
jgi:hypothetical protein